MNSAKKAKQELATIDEALRQLKELAIAPAAREDNQRLLLVLKIEAAQRSLTIVKGVVEIMTSGYERLYVCSDSEMGDGDLARELAADVLDLNLPSTGDLNDRKSK